MPEQTGSSGSAAGGPFDDDILAVLGTINDPVVNSNAVGTISSKMRGLVQGVFENIGWASDAESASGSASAIAIFKRIRTLLSPSATVAHTNISISAASTIVLTANARKKYTLTNDSSVYVYLKHDTGASATSFITRMVPGEFLEDDWQGVVYHIGDFATGALRVGEYT